MIQKEVQELFAEDGKFSAQLNIKLTANQKAKIEELATKRIANGRSSSKADFMRKIIQAGLMCIDENGDRPRLKIEKTQDHE